MERLLLLLIGLCAVEASVARAGIVQTAQGRLEGKVSFDAEHVTIDGRKVPWSDVLYLLPDATATVPPRPQQVLLKNGEAWRCDVVRLADKQLTLRCDLFGEKKVDAARVAAIEFTRASGGNSSGSPRKPQTLYRTKGDAIPGTLLGIDADKLNIDSILGTLTLPREGLAGYVFAGSPTAFEKDIDELALIDGTIFRGRIQPAADALKLTHPLLGEIKVPFRLVRSVVRHTPQVSDLTELAPKSVQSVSLIAGNDSSGRVQTVRGDGCDSPRFIKGLLVEPKTVIRYVLPSTTAKTVYLRAVVLPMPGAAGDIKLRVRSGKDVLLDKELEATGKPVAIAVELPASSELELEVDFGKRLRFPCGIILADPHLIPNR